MAFRLPPPPTSGQSSQQHNIVLDNYYHLRNSYLNMINKDNEDNTFTVDPAAPALVPLPAGSTVAAAPSGAFDASPFIVDQADVDSFRELLELCGMTPETPALNNFDGSPMDDTPLFTPALDMFGTTTPYLDGWDASPAMGDEDSFDPFPPLFIMPTQKAPLNTTQNENTHNTIADQSQLFTLPQTPSLAPTSLLPETAVSPSAANARTKTNGPNGFRKGTNPANMVPMDAPTQTRQYLSDSKTSRKEIPAAFQNKARKRQRDEMLDDDEVPDDIQDAISAKRRLNTLAARRSRARKAQTALENEERIGELTSQVEYLQQELVRVTAERDTYRSQLGLM